MTKNMKTSIIIPTYNHWELTSQLVYDLLRVSTYPTEILIVDNGSQEPAPIELSEWRTVHILSIEENIGFLMACNTGVEVADGDLIHLISNDVRVHKDVVRFVAGLISGNPNQLIGGVLRNYDTGWNTFNGRVYPYLEGWYLAFTKQVWNDLGGFDPRYAPYDFEDVDLSTTALTKPYDLYQMPEGYLEHIGAQTIGYNPEREAITRQHQELFREKWTAVGTD